MRPRHGFVSLLLIFLSAISAAGQRTVMIDDLTGTEVMQAIAGGKTTCIIYIGGVHENTYQAENTPYVGPHVDAVAINKHNVVALYQARRVAEELGNALAYYPLPYTPAGSHLKPATAGGTIALSDTTFAAVLRDMANSAAVSGFKHIVMMGEDGGGQAVIRKVAEELDRDYSSKGIRVFFFPVYADANRVTAEYLKKVDGFPAECLANGIGGCISATTDASEILFLKKENVRTEKISPAIAKFVSPELGRILNEQKVKIAVDYIRAKIR
ncbi:MAG: creatininase family protein [Acidobacteria bacterium]|nr:creatininase family protein [Acidobacteriota bacterium]